MRPVHVLVEAIKMVRYCAEASCKEGDTKDSPYSFHRFPTEPKRRQQWLDKVNRETRNEKGNRVKWQPSEPDVLCSKHFLDSSFTDRTILSRKMNLPYKPKLREDAVPTTMLHTIAKRKKEEDYAAKRSAVAEKKLKREVLSQLLDDPKPSDPKEGSDAGIPDVDETMNPVPAGASVSTDTVTAANKQDKQLQVNMLTTPLNMTSVHQQTERIPTASKKSQADAAQPVPKSSRGIPCNQSTRNSECQTDAIGPIINDDDDDEILEGNDFGAENEEPGWQPQDQQDPRQTLQEDLNTVDPFEKRKYIVFECQLEELLCLCRKCRGPCQVMKKGECGTSVEYDCTCDDSSCGFKFHWRSQPYSNQLPLGNFVLAAAVFFTALSPTRLITAFRHVNIACISLQTYYSLQNAYMLHAVRRVWQRCQEGLFLSRQGRSVKLAGDGRCDSPGHCAKYGSYSLMDAETAEILHCELVQSNQVKNSHAMELEGLKKGLAELKGRVNVSHLITDRHASIKKYMRDFHLKEEHQQNITHHFDIWHMAKGVGKKLETAGKKSQNANIALWAKSVKNHMYWCATSTPEGSNREQIVKDTWLSISNHVADIHVGHSESFAECAHGTLTTPRAWIKKGSRQHRILENIISSKFLLRDIGMLSPDVQTASLESYHAVVCHFAPKLTSFKYTVMQAKLYLAAMHFNANADRKQATTEEGELQWTIARPRATKGQPVAKPRMEPQRRNYLNELFAEAILLRLEHPSYKKADKAQSAFKTSVPRHLSETAPTVDKATVVAKQKPRLNWARLQH